MRVISKLPVLSTLGKQVTKPYYFNFEFFEKTTDVQLRGYMPVRIHNWMSSVNHYIKMVNLPKLPHSATFKLTSYIKKINDDKILFYNLCRVVSSTCT